MFDLERLEALLSTHADAVRTHTDAIDSHEQALNRRNAANSHGELAAKHARQRAVHDRIAVRHSGVMAQLRLLVEAIPEAVWIAAQSPRLLRARTVHLSVNGFTH